MPGDEWQTLPFSEAVTINPSVRLQRGQVYPYVDMKAIDPAHPFVSATERRPFPGGGSRFEDGDTLFARITPCLENGKVARFVLPGSDGPAHGSTEFIIVRGRAGVTDSGFAFYLSRSAYVRNFAIGQMTGTSGRQRVPTDCFDQLMVDLPPLVEQTEIAKVLGALDDKIEQNRRTSRALERLARTIFRAWFVDFEPVKAKASATELPSMPRLIFDSLPDTLVDSEVGSIPKGWTVKPLTGVAALTMGQSPSSEFYNESGEGLPFHQGVTDFGFRFPAHRVYCTTEGRLAEPGDILLSVRAPVGRINVTDRQIVLGRGLAGLRHLDGQQSYLFYQLRHVFAEEDAIGDGTIYKAVTKAFLQGMEMLVPPKEIRMAFENMAKPMDDLILRTEHETRALARMRDLLLPRLLSGQVRVEVRHG